MGSTPAKPSTTTSAVHSVRVLLPLPVYQSFDYCAEIAAGLKPGDLVRVPFGKRQAIGCVWDEGAKEGGLPRKEAPPRAGALKSVAGKIEAPPLPRPLRRFLDWVASYNCAPLGSVLRMTLSVSEALAEEKEAALYRRAENIPATHKTTPAREKVFKALEEMKAARASEIAKRAGVSPGVVKGLVEAGVLVSAPVQHEPLFARPDTKNPDAVTLSADQKEAAGELTGLVRAHEFSVTLLDGVTGSGKTEVYFEAIAAALEQNRQALVLVPEITLTTQWLERFARRFGVVPAQWHSGLTPAQRRKTWRAVSHGEAGVVVAARSGLFLPFPDLGLIVVDEEHDPTFKQDEGVIYNARDMAVVRAREERAPVLLVSATPSIETMSNAQTGRYRHLHLPERHGAAELPAITALDMRQHPPARGQWLSPVLLSALGETFARGEQALLFLNRRGYAPLTLCRHCGHRLACPRCSAWLVEHRQKGTLDCHHCGHSIARPPSCPQCAHEDALAACGPGVERLLEEARQHFPDIRIALMTSDTIGTPQAAKTLIEKIEAGAIDLVIGTQIVAKGHHFPLLTLVGVVDADLGLAGGDLRAAERTYQLLHQVAGRAGRAAHKGSCYLQTFSPEHPVMAALVSGDRDKFLAEETRARELFNLPPFGRLAAIIVSGKNEKKVAETARALARRAPRGEGIPVEVLGPAPAPLALLRGRHRWRLLLKAPRHTNLQDYIRAWMGADGTGKTPRRGGDDLRVRIDVDPLSFL